MLGFNSVNKASHNISLTDNLLWLTEISACEISANRRLTLLCCNQVSIGKEKLKVLN